MLSFDTQADIGTNADLMLESISLVKSVEVTRATRSTKLNGFSIKKGQPIGMLDNKILAVSDSMSGLIIDMLDKINLAEAETVSIYYGLDVEKSEADNIRELMFSKNEKLNIEIAYGGQPLYSYTISIE
jgi:dihydroxyacetone kinase-like predicted kinase